MNDSHPPTLEQALALHREGRLADAEQAYRRIVAAQPASADGWHCLGVVLLESERAETAIGPLSRAVELRPEQASYYGPLARAAEAAGRADVAELCLRQAIGLGRDELNFDLGLLLHRQGRTDEAIGCYRAALKKTPDAFDVLNNLGVALHETGRSAEAVACYLRALDLRPEHGDGHNNLGNALQSLGRPDEALASFRRAVALRPDSVDALNNLGNLLKSLGRSDEAIDCYRRLVTLAPDFAAAHYNLGDALQERGELPAAADCYRQSLRAAPDYADAHNNLGTALKDLGDFAAAESCYRRAIECDPQLAIAHYNLATTRLYHGDFAAGWAGYEWRWKTKSHVRREFDRPLWRGEPPAGRTILLHCEQGLGDTMQFIRYAAVVRRRGARVVVECQPPLAPLLAGCPGIDHLVRKGDPLPEFDLHAPLLSLPWIVGSTLDDLPRETPYLTADPTLVESWRERLAAWPGFKVGIHWQGNPQYAADRVRSIPLEQFCALADVPGVQFFSLQKGVGRRQLPDVAGRLPVVDLGEELDATTGAFVDTAAVIRNLDLVITSDTALPHLAGALAAPVWMALPWVPDWRWMLEGERCPWYPTMRLFRQQTAGDWPGLFRAIRQALAELPGLRLGQG